MATSHSAPAYELRDYGELLRRRKWIIALGLVLGLAAGLAALRVLPKTYTATTSVLVSATPLPDAQIVGSRTSGDINLDTESQLVTSSDVATLAAKAMKSKDSIDTLIGNVKVAVPPNTNVLSISYDAANPKSAQQWSHAFAKAYLDNRAALSTAAVAVQVKDLTAQLTTASNSLAQASTKAAGLASNSPEKVAIQAQVTRLTAALSSLDTSLSKLQSTPITPGRILSDATLPTKPSNPNPLVVLSAGVMSGLLLGLLLALVRDRTDKKVRRSTDLERLIDVPLL
ncbi:MAG: Wzz/FepE/Etk N-terminal domain-containing protein, partial [Actinomycetota bacterium]|nr:Wzz/FepE/Etk N-terminal domain-containing protein [Actinomycetota bacterium]